MCTLTVAILSNTAHTHAHTPFFQFAHLHICPFVPDTATISATGTAQALFADSDSSNGSCRFESKSSMRANRQT